MELTKSQRKLFATAERADKTRTRKRRERSDEPRITQVFCGGCHALLEEGKCPRCDRNEGVYDKFCRRCLHVHKNNVACRAWKPSGSNAAPATLCKKGCFGIGACGH